MQQVPFVIVRPWNELRIEGTGTCLDVVGRPKGRTHSAKPSFLVRGLIIGLVSSSGPD